MFTPEFRARLRSELLDYAAQDSRLAGAAITGSAATDQEDRWSDIDLAFGVIEPKHMPAVLADFTQRLYEQYAALHHHDIRAGAWLYRVFFLPGTLQVDLAFVAQSDFRPLSSSFRLVWGAAHALQAIPPPVPQEIIGLAWLYALHARACILREKFWQAEYMISALRDHVLVLACLRHHLAWAYGRGVDQLPPSLTTPLASALVCKLESSELWRAFSVALHGLVSEIESTDPALSARIKADLLTLAANPVNVLSSV